MLCGLFGVRALLAAYVSRVTEADSSCKADISAVFIVDNTICSALIPFALSGLFTGMKCFGYMNEKNVRKVTTVLLIFSGVSLVLRSL